MLCTAAVHMVMIHSPVKRSLQWSNTACSHSLIDPLFIKRQLAGYRITRISILISTSSQGRHYGLDYSGAGIILWSTAATAGKAGSGWYKTVDQTESSYYSSSWDLHTQATHAAGNQSEEEEITYILLQDGKLATSDHFLLLMHHG